MATGTVRDQPDDGAGWLEGPACREGTSARPSRMASDSERRSLRAAMCVAV